MNQVHLEMERSRPDLKGQKDRRDLPDPLVHPVRRRVVSTVREVSATPCQPLEHQRNTAQRASTENLDHQDRLARLDQAVLLVNQDRLDHQDTKECQGHPVPLDQPEA